MGGMALLVLKGHQVNLVLQALRELLGRQDQGETKDHRVREQRA